MKNLFVEGPATWDHRTRAALGRVARRAASAVEAGESDDNSVLFAGMMPILNRNHIHIADAWEFCSLMVALDIIGCMEEQRNAESLPAAS